MVLLKSKSLRMKLCSPFECKVYHSSVKSSQFSNDAPGRTLTVDQSIFDKSNDFNASIQKLFVPLVKKQNH